MNASIEKLILQMPDFQNEIIEIITVAEEPLTLSVTNEFAALQRKMSMLRNYEATMRRHAVACEAGR